MSSFFRRACVLVVALALMVVLPLAGIGPVRSVAAADAGSKISITLNCTGNPERVTIKNNTGSTIKVTSIGSKYQPRSGEPYKVNVSIGAGNSKSFTAGPGASGTLKLTNQYIFENSVGTSEGVRIVTSVGNKAKSCGTTSSGGGTTPKPTCDPNYTGVCFPVGAADIDCGEISARNFRSVGSDPHGLDRDNDGIACEA